MAEPGVMQIGELADRTELSLRTIRHYDQIGLLKPSGRSVGGFRLYTEDDVSRLMLIRRMKPLGYSLEQMAELLAVLDSRAEQSPEIFDEAIARFRDDAAARRERLKRHLAMADEFLGELADL